MSRYHCGSARAGYRCTAEYMDGQLSLATAAAVSGAAVSPNMGSKTPSAALALFLSLFNVRLGFWAPTPSGRRWREPHARLWPFYILRETLSNTGQIGSYCYLTDGGHFDNTGLYALVERGCRYIVVSDCGADPDLAFEDIGVAIRRCRIDFGAEIDVSHRRFLQADAARSDRPRPTSSGGASRISRNIWTYWVSVPIRRTASSCGSSRPSRRRTPWTSSSITARTPISRSNRPRTSGTTRASSRATDGSDTAAPGMPSRICLVRLRWSRGTSTRSRDGLTRICEDAPVSADVVPTLAINNGNVTIEFSKCCRRP